MTVPWSPVHEYQDRHAPVADLAMTQVSFTVHICVRQSGWNVGQGSNHGNLSGRV